ncbi:SpoIIE family protein phosphatase [candidate division GN15 bacterium]|nr:SpoIIE family protein phosphatase [candidate division GN15 bacterium]
MFQRAVKEINAEFIAEEKYLDSIQRTVREACNSSGMSRRDTQAVLLAIEEGATNIIRHAYLYEKGTIRLRVVIYKKLVIFSLIDFGRSFQPEGSGTVDLQKLVESGRKGGLGFYMIQKIMDSTEYISAAGRNELRMIKRIRPSRDGSVPLLRRFFGLRVKFSFWTFLIVAIIVGGSYYYMDRQTSRQLFNHLDERVAALTKTIADQAAGYVLRSRSDVEFDELIVSYMRANPELQMVALVDDEGLIMAHSEDVQSIRKPYNAPPGVDPRLWGVSQRLEDSPEALYYLAMQIETGGRDIGSAHVVYSSAQLAGKLADARVRIVLLTTLLLLFGIAGIYVLSNYFVSPIVKITQRVRRFTRGDLETELPLEGAEEFFEISRAFNEMITRLSQDRKNIVAREKMAKEIEVASQIQKTLLPHELPEVPGLEVDAFYRAASIVGGDLYDIFPISQQRYCMVVADVSGKGVPASLVMSMLRTVIQINATEATSAHEVLTKVDRYLQSNMPPSMFITIMLIIYDAETSQIKFVSAGHNPMLYYQARSGKLSTLNPTGMPLGMTSTISDDFDKRLEEVQLELKEGDLFFVFTDGVNEATNREGEQFGFDRLKSFMKRQLDDDKSFTVKQLSSSLVSELDDFSGFVKATDDITFIVARACRSRQQGTETAQGDKKAVQPEIDRQTL